MENVVIRQRLIRITKRSVKRRRLTLVIIGAISFTNAMLPIYWRKGHHLPDSYKISSFLFNGSKKCIIVAE